MISRRLILALPPLAFSIWAVPSTANTPDALAQAIAACWRARGINFTSDQVAARIGGRKGKAALLALAGATESADDEGVETMVEIVWEAGAPPSPALPLMARDLANGLPLLVLARDGRAWLLERRTGDQLSVVDPLTGHKQLLALASAVLIGRPVIAGA